jgi:hypothetical protein
MIVVVRSFLEEKKGGVGARVRDVFVVEVKRGSDESERH